jgi:hypothetical protein
MAKAPRDPRTGRYIAAKAKQPRYSRSHQQTRMTGGNKPSRPQSEIGTPRVSRLRRGRHPHVVLPE